jgi:hypothetical protein
LGIDSALGTDFTGRLALWQVLARVLDQTVVDAALKFDDPLTIAEFSLRHGCEVARMIARCRASKQIARGE